MSVDRMSLTGHTEVQASRVWISALKIARINAMALPSRCGQAGICERTNRIAKEIGEAGDRRERAEDDTDDEKPGGEIRPHDLGGDNIGDVGEQRSDEARNRYGHQYRMNWMAGDFSRGSLARLLGMKHRSFTPSPMRAQRRIPIRGSLG